MDFNKYFSCPAMVGIAETDDETSECDDSGNKTNLLNLPVEIHAKILHLLDPLDILAYSRTCRTLYKYADNQQLW